MSDIIYSISLDKLGKELALEEATLSKKELKKRRKEEKKALKF